jgi:hypothetical protein
LTAEALTVIAEVSLAIAPRFDWICVLSCTVVIIVIIIR